MEKSTFVIDIDGTFCVAEKPAASESYDYANARPIWPVIKKIRSLKADGHTIILHTARGMRTHRGDREMIEIDVRPVLVEWLKKYEVPYDDLIMGKPWGPNVYYVDDRCLSPFDFAYKNEFKQIIATNIITL